MKKVELPTLAKQENSGLPNGWRRFKIGQVAKVASGGTPERKRSDYWNGDIPWISTSLINFNLITEAEEHISDKGLNGSAAKLFPIGTILMAMYGQGKTRGKVALLGIEAATNQACAAIISDSQKVERKLLFYNLWSRYAEIRNYSNTGNQENLSGGLIKLLPISLPPLPEQRKIAAILTAWDEAIQTAQQLLKARQLRKSALMQKLLTGQVRLLGYTDAWREVKAGKIFKNVSVKNKPNEELLSATQEFGVVPRSSLEARVTMPKSDTKSYKLVEKGDFVISLRSFQGGIEYSEHRGVVSPAYTVLKPIVPIEKGFYKHYYKSERFIRRLGVAVIGIRDGKQVSFQDFSAIPLPYPNPIEQRAISDVINAADEEIRLATAEIEVLQAQKRGLMQQLLTGKTRVRVEE